MDADERGEEGAGQGGQPGPQAEGHESHEPRIDAQRLRQLLVHDHRPGHDANLRALHHEPHAHAQDDREQQQHKAVFGVRRPADIHRPADRALGEADLPAEVQRDELHDDDVEPPGGEDGVHGPRVKPAEHPPFHQRRAGDADDEGDKERRPRVPAEPGRDDAGVGADREERAVGQVDDLEDAVDDQEAERDDVQHASGRDDVEQLGGEHGARPPLATRAYFKLGHWLPGSTSPKLLRTFVLPLACTWAR